MNDIDLLMQRMDEINHKQADELVASDIDTIIAYHRRYRQLKASGQKITKPKLDLSTIMNIKPKPFAPFTRRI